MAKIDDILRLMVERGASDLHLTTTMRPYLREHGEMTSLSQFEPLTAAESRSLLYEILPEKCLPAFEETWEADFSYEANGVGRFRVNMFRDRLGLAGVLRAIPSVPLTADELNLPKVVRDLCYLPNGLVLVTGPTGSGKSTTLAAMIDMINKTRRDHVITIEDPIEFVHMPRKCLVTQREVHSHTKSFAAAVRASLREDPDIILVGEMRDLETMETAIETAETGHLVFGTLHTNTAATTVERIIDKFPSARQNQIRSMLATSLKAVIAQNLCLRKGGKGRVAAMEILVVTPAVASLIREGKAHQIGSVIQTGKAMGMVVMEDALLQLAVDGVVTAREAYSKAVDKVNMAKKLSAANIPLELSEDVDDAPATTRESSHVQEQVNRLMAIIKGDPENVAALNNLAWILATTSNPLYKNNPAALRLAQKANTLSMGQHPGVLDTLGAVYADAGEFAQAITAARRGAELAEAIGDHRLAQALEHRIVLYESRRPAREGVARSG